MPQLSPELTARIKEEAEQNEYDTQRLEPASAYVSGATKYALLLEESQRLNEEWNFLFSPLLDYGQSAAANIPLGASITATILERAKAAAEALERIQYRCAVNGSTSEIWHDADNALKSWTAIGEADKQQKL